jgi:ankyrin repeat protein/pimeloyl-ACP methyl ester carboxylesterase
MKRFLFLLGALCICSLIECVTVETIPPGAEPEVHETSSDGSAAAPSNWRFYPAFARFGLNVDISPAPEVGESAEIVLFSTMDEMSLLAVLIDGATGEFLQGGVTVRNEADIWQIDVSFPESGSYELHLFAKTDSQEDYEKVANVAFKAKFSVDSSAMLLSAIRYNDPERLKRALESGADPNTPMPGYMEVYIDGKPTVVDGYPVFGVLEWHEATEKQIAALELLADHGADFRVLNSAGDTLISQFFQFRKGTPEERLQLLRTLLDLGADPAQETAYTYIQDDKPVHTTIGTLLDMERFGYDRARELAAYVPLLIQHGARADARWPWGATALEGLFGRYAEGTAPLIRSYIQAGVDPNPDELRTMMFMVTSSRFDGDYELISLVLSRTTHLNDLDESGQAFLHNLVERTKASPGVRRRLFDILAAVGADFYVSNRYGETPLMAAVKSSNTAVVDELLDRGIDPRTPGPTGKNVFHVLPGLSPEVKSLVERFLALGVDINARDISGKTALYYAAKSDESIEFVRYLVSKGADPSVPDLDGLTARGNAKNLEQRKLADYLASLNVPEASGGWPVGNASRACRAIINVDLSSIRSIPARDFQEITARTDDGVPATPLHLAVEAGNLGVIAAISDRGVDWNVGDRYGRTPLEIAVLAENADVVAALLQAGADPNTRNNRGESAFSRSIGTGSRMTEVLMGSGIEADWRTVAFFVAASATVDLAMQLSSKSSWTSRDLDTCVMLGRTDILEYLGDSVRHHTKSRDVLLSEAESRRKSYLSYESEAKIPLSGLNVQKEMKHKRGSYTLTLESWSPWLDVDPKLDLAQYPVAVYVPRGYDGSQSYGLIISMMNAKSSSQFPKPEYIDTLDDHHLLYVGFDPYNGIFYDSSADYMYTSHEGLVLAAVYHMLGAYNVDRNRIYLTGFSWGGRLTGEIVPRQPRIFTGGIAVGGCFTSGARIIPSFPYASKRAVMVLATGDWDYNRDETYNGYDTFLALGYKAYYIQEPRRGHARISGENFEKAVSLLDRAASARR